MLKNLVRCVSIALIAALPVLGQPAAASAAGGTLFGITGFGQSVLSTIDPASGQVSDIEELAGSEQGQVVSVTGDPTAHRIYALRESTIFIPPTTIVVHNQILTVNSDNGSFTASPTGTVASGQIVFDTGTDTLYQLGFNGALLKVDPATGKTALVATLPISNPGDIEQMTVVPGANRIYVADIMFDFLNGGFDSDLITVNPVTGATTTSPINSGRLGFLMYDSSAGLLLTSDNSNLYSVDPASGATTLIANYNTNPQALFFNTGAIDPATNTVYLQLNVYDFFNPPGLDQIIAINDQSGAFTSSTGNLTTNQLESEYFQPQVVVTADSIAADVNSSLASGQITKPGVASTLLSDLTAAAAAHDRGQCKAAANIYQQFISDVAAQSGKSIAIATASRLTSEAEFLQASCP